MKIMIILTLCTISYSVPARDPFLSVYERIIASAAPSHPPTSTNRRGHVYYFVPKADSTPYYPDQQTTSQSTAPSQPPASANRSGHIYYFVPKAQSTPYYLGQQTSSRSTASPHSPTFSNRNGQIFYFVPKAQSTPSYSTPQTRAWSTESTPPYAPLGQNWYSNSENGYYYYPTPKTTASPKPPSGPTFIYPNVTIVIFDENRYWNIPVDSKPNTPISVSLPGPNREILWILEYVNVTSNEPRYAIRAFHKPELYITYHIERGLSLQEIESQGRYFLFELGENDGYTFRVPGRNVSLGTRKRTLFLRPGRFEFRLQPARGDPPRVCDKHEDLLIMKTAEFEFWTYSDISLYINVASIVNGDKPIWKSRIGANGRNFRPFGNQDVYVTYLNGVEEVHLQQILPGNSLINREFGLKYNSNSHKIFTNENEKNYISINQMDSILKWTDRQNQAVDWRHTHFGFCCENECLPKSLVQSFEPPSTTSIAPQLYA